MGYRKIAYRNLIFFVHEFHGRVVCKLSLRDVPIEIHWLFHGSNNTWDCLRLAN